jgi:Asp-tRNA(Asn)/Glu-tRNA(Gln) amidotransferase A subunit family amidase
MTVESKPPVHQGHRQPSTAADELCFLPAVELARAVRQNRLSPVEIAEAFIARVERVNPDLNALIHFDPDQVRADARELERAQQGSTPLGSLHGVPYTIKDLTAMKDLPLTFGMVPLKDNIAEVDAAVVTGLRGAGGLFLGKTNTPESGYYGGTDNHLFGPTHNPWKHGHTTGGSSGGAAAAVAAGLGPLAEGSDGAGSIRIPSAMCGVVGLKPSLGRVPQTVLQGRFYNWAFHGPITRTVADNALMLDVLAGASMTDPMTLPDPADSFVQAIEGDIRGWRVAYSPDLGLGDVDPEVADIVHEAASAFEELGAHVAEATPPWENPEQPMWHGIWVPAFASEHDLLDWDQLHGQVDENLIELIHEGEQVTALDIGRADAFRGRMWDGYAAFMADYDILVSPTLATAAFPHGRFAPEWLDGESLQRQLLGWLLTYPYNMLTVPAITVPAGFTADGRPVGLQIGGKLHADAAVLRAAACFEAARPWADRRPAL